MFNCFRCFERLMGNFRKRKKVKEPVIITRKEWLRRYEDDRNAYKYANKNKYNYEPSIYDTSSSYHNTFR